MREAAQETAQQELNAVVAGLWLTALIPIGLLPSFGFFTWIERNCTLPVLPLTLGWPWIDGSTWSLPAKLGWNGLLFALFGALHTLFAQPRIQKRLWAWIPLQARRSFYIMLTGVTLTAVASTWQSTGLVLWALPLRPDRMILLSPLVFWMLYLPGIALLVRHDFLGFFGLRQLFQTRGEILASEQTPRLVTDGVYGVVRHPIYTFTLAAILIAPMMTLDRFWIFAVMVGYLAWAIPIEEKKLVSLFGEKYSDYQTQIPAVFPRFGIKKAPL